MATTAWLAPTTATAPLNGGSTPYINKDDALVLDGVVASASGAFSNPLLKLRRPGALSSTKWLVGLSAQSPLQTVTKANSTTATYADLAAGLLVAVGIKIGVYDYDLELSGFDYSSIPSGSTINNASVRITYKYVTGSLIEIDFAQLQLDYTPPVQYLAASSISTGEVIGTATLVADPVNLSAASIGGVEAFGTAALTMSASQAGGISTGEAFGTATLTQSAPPPPPDPSWSALGKEDEKEFVYKVRKADGTFVGMWSGIKDPLKFTQRINTPGTTTTIQLPRSPNNRTEVRANLTTEAGDKITAEDGSRLVATYETSNTVGADSDVELGYLVDIYAYYGEFGRLLTEAGDFMTTEDGDYLLISSGAPQGVRVFSGFILDYKSKYGQTSGVTVTLASHGYRLSHEVVRSGATTTVSYSSQPLETTLKSVLDTNPQVMTYDASSIQATGVSAALKFQLNTKLEAINTIYDQTPDGWYWYGDVAENLIYMKAQSLGYDHVFIIGHHVKELEVTRTLEGLTNKVYFVGGEVTPGTPSSTLYKLYQDSASQTAWGVGLQRITDRRYTVAANAQRKAEKAYELSPVFTSPVTISSARYDIETIKLGQTVGFINAGNFLDELDPLLIVSKNYSPTEVTLELGALLDRQVESVADLEADLNNEAYETLPTTPS